MAARLRRSLIIREAKRLGQRLSESELVFVLFVQFISVLLAEMRVFLEIIYSSLLRQLPDLITRQIPQLLLRVHAIMSILRQLIWHEHGSGFSQIELFLRQQRLVFDAAGY